MRDTTVRQPRVPHSWELLSEDCNVPVPRIRSMLEAPDVSGDLNRGLQMFAMFLDGRSYEAIAFVFNASRHDVNTSVHRAYRWVRQTCQPCD